MRTEICAICGRGLADGATFCPTCAHQLDAAIAEIAELRGLAYDLDIALTRQDRIDRPGGTYRPAEEDDDGRQWPGTLKPTASPYDQRASEAAAELARTLRKWAFRIKRETGSGYPPRRLELLARWLRPRVGWLRYHPDGAQAYREILDAVARARRTVDRPSEKIYAGPCDCGEDLYARLAADYVVCRNHEQPIVWPVEERRRWLLKSAEDVLATTTEISRALTRYSQPVTGDAIRGYVHRGRLVAKGERPEPGKKKPTPLYRLGDVLDILARQAERVTA